MLLSHTWATIRKNLQRPAENCVFTIWLRFSVLLKDTLGMGTGSKAAVGGVRSHRMEHTHLDGGIITQPTVQRHCRLLSMVKGTAARYGAFRKECQTIDFFSCFFAERARRRLKWHKVSTEARLKFWDDSKVADRMKSSPRVFQSRRVDGSIDRKHHRNTNPKPLPSKPTAWLLLTGNRNKNLIQDSSDYYNSCSTGAVNWEWGGGGDKWFVHYVISHI